MKKELAKLLLLLLGVFFSSTIMPQTTVTGVVKDDLNEPLTGVSILIKGTTKGTITDLDGRFTISANNTSDILVFSYLGYKSKELKVVTGKTMQVVLNEDAKALEEVVVVGYQDVRVKDLTGSVGKANVADMLKAPVSTFDQALAGRLAGVNVSSGEGTPGGSMNIVIRGNNSVTQENSPLYVIDGFPVEDPTAGSSINPNDIESLNILKDASATAIYGARGANGVVIITTKQGKVGKLAINYDGTFGVQRVSNKIPMMNAYDFVKLQEEIWTPAEMYGENGYYATIGGKTYSAEDYINTPQYNWQDEIFQDAWQQSHNVSLTGGSETSRYNASVSYYDQDGILLKSNYNRIQGRVGNTMQRNKLKLNLNANFSRTTRFGNSPSESSYSGMNNLFYSVWGYRPVTQPSIPLNSLVDNITDEGVNPLNDYRFNPILSLQNEYREAVIDYNQYSGYAEYEFIKGLKLKVSGTFTTDNRRTDVFNNSKTRYGSPASIDKVNATQSTSYRNTWLNENILSYQKIFNKKHNFNALVGMTLQESDYTAYSMRTINIPNESLGMAGMGQGTPNAITSLESEWSMMSYLGRVNYNYQSKYYATASIRADGSSKFRGKNRWGYFPSASLAWTFTEEPFLQSIKPVLGTGKLRLSWGQTGNNRVGDYDTYSILQVMRTAEGNYVYDDAITHGVYPFNNQTSNAGTVPYRLPNEDLRWETTTQTNIGVDLFFLKERIELTVDWYNKTTSDLLLKSSLVYSSGYGSAMKNIGKVENRGLEFTLNTVNIQTKNFRWTTNFNIAFNRNKVLGLAEDQLSLLTNGRFDQNFTASNYIAKIGYPIGMMYGYIYEGTYKLDEFDKSGSSYVLKEGIPHYTSESNTQPGYPKYKDLNNDGVIDSNDQTIIGRGDPIHIGGFTNNFEYKGFDLSIFFQWSYGNEILNANRLMFESAFNNKKDLNQFASYKDRWTFDNPESNIPRTSTSSSNLLFSSRVIEDGSYLRLKTVSLGYTFNSKTIEKIGITKARVFVSGQNLLTISNYSGYDPEVSIRNTALTPGLDFSAYPRAMSFNMGVNVNF